MTTDPTQLDTHWRPQTHYLEGINYDQFFRMDQMDVLMSILEERAGMPLNRHARNVTGSGHGIDVGGAMDLSPVEIAAYPKINRSSFFDEGMQEAVKTVFASDVALFQQTKR